MTVANKITTLRFVIGVIYLVFLSFAINEWMMLTALALFVLFCIGDIVDGVVARSTGQVSSFGRIFDPLADKIVICCSFVILLKFDEITFILYNWVVVIIICREMLVDTLRVYVEKKGVEFGADILGKIKMLTQCLAIVGLILHLQWFTQKELTFYLRWFIWFMVFITLVSGINYVVKAIKFLSVK